MASSSGSEERKKKRKLRDKQNTEEPVKKKTRTHDQVGSSLSEDVTNVDKEKTSEKRKKKKKERTEEYLEVTKEADTKKKSKESKKKQGQKSNSDDTALADDDKVAIVGDVSNSEKTVKDRKKKRTKDTPVIADSSAPVKEKKEKKGKKSSREAGSIYPDPAEDDSLSDKAKAALSYAHKKVIQTQNWKFNKALQIWLVKNFWSSELIPDRYLQVVTQYLSGSQGAARTNLIDDCRSVLADDDSREDNPEEHGAVEVDSKSSSTRPKVQKTDVTRSRARTLLAALTSDSS